MRESFWIAFKLLDPESYSKILKITIFLKIWNLNLGSDLLNFGEFLWYHEFFMDFHSKKLIHGHGSVFFDEMWQFEDKKWEIQKRHGYQFQISKVYKLKKFSSIFGANRWCTTQFHSNRLISFDVLAVQTRLRNPTFATKNSFGIDQQLMFDLDSWFLSVCSHL